MIDFNGVWHFSEYYINGSEVVSLHTCAVDSVVQLYHDVFKAF